MGSESAESASTSSRGHISSWWTIALHLLPGLAFGAFVPAAVPALDHRSLDPPLALLGGIALVPVPLELSHLAVQAHRNGQPFAVTSAIVMVLIGCAAGGGGVVAFSRRDIVGA